MNGLLTATNLTKTFTQGDSSNTVLRDVSMEIQPGEFVAIMGPSGSGKSTLLYCVSGMDDFQTGKVMLSGVDLGKLSDDERTTLRGERLGFVFQDPNLLESLNVLDNILLPASMQPGANADDLTRRARELMQTTGIDELADRGVSEISGGQKQRVSLCRALLHTPDLLFGDEPTGALNSKASAEIIELLHTFNANGMTMLIVTHDARVAAHATRVLFLSDGRIVHEVTADPESDIASREQAVLGVMANLGI